MQVYARDSLSTLIFAEKANKHQDYRCVECQQVVRLRKGLHRQAHFYHTQPNRACRQHGKGMPHLMLQYYLKNLLPSEEVELECHFPKIGRIADVAWHAKRLIYEIQCSPISAEEVKARNAHYHSIGYQVIWVFHDKRYNQYRLTEAEHFVLDHPHYFSDMDEQGKGRIYDEFSMIVNGKRIQRLPLLSVDLSTVQFSEKETIRSWPFVLNRRRKMWPLYFLGDALHTAFHRDQKQVLTIDQQVFILKLEELVDKRKSVFAFKNFFKEWVIKPYQAFFKLILEQACR